MHTCRDEIVPGDIVVRQGRYYVVIGLVGEQLKLVAVLPVAGARHRADIRAVSPTELATVGLAGTDAIIACRSLLSGHRRHYVRLGAVSPLTLERIAGALRREHAAQRNEAVAGLGSQLLALTASSGRRVGAGRAS